MRRLASSRGTRTQTPARKENPTLEGFEAALLADNLINTQRKPSTATQNPMESHRHIISTIKEPMQVMLYGYSPDAQWAAIEFYEKISGGMVCEDYEREPPLERRRYQGGIGRGEQNKLRPLTKQEKLLAMQYKGGSTWIKVTFDSREAAECAINNSPHPIQGHWVYAQPYHGQGREKDEPILIKDDNRQQGLLSAPRPSVRQSQTIGSSFPVASLRQNSGYKHNATLTRSIHSSSTSAQPTLSSSTASSATVLEPDYHQLRARQTSQIERNISSQPVGNQNPPTFSHFPDTCRTLIRPATEAFLPQPTWSERFIQQLTQSGWIPGDVIGNAVPMTQGGDFDWATASFYWKICYWIDNTFGTDICGMNEG
jgi:hypothetical protein